MRIFEGAPVPSVAFGSEGARYVYGVGGHTVVMTSPSPSPLAIRSVRDGRIEAGSAILPPVIVLLLQCGLLPWIDAPYCRIELDAVEPSALQAALTSEPNDTLNIVLVDSTTRLACAVRVVTLPSQVSRALIAAVLEHEAGPHINQRQIDVALASMPPPHVLAAHLEHGVCHDVVVDDQVQGASPLRPDVVKVT